MNKLREKLTKEVIGLLLSGATALLLLANLLSGTLAPEVKLKGTISFDAVYATSTQYSIVAAGTSEKLRATSSCAMRVITTKASPILLTFSDEEPTPTKGILQAASTTVNYTAEQYGCGAVKAITGNSAASTVTLTEFR